MTSSDRIEDGHFEEAVKSLIERSEGSDALPLRGEVEQVLHALRERLRSDVVFVAEFVEGKRIYRFVDRVAEAPSIEAGEYDELADSLCQRVVDGRLPGFIANMAALDASYDVPPIAFRIRTHLSTPIVLRDGRVFGTLCCFSAAANPASGPEGLEVMRQCAQLVAHKVERAGLCGQSDPPPDPSPPPRPTYRSEIWNLKGAWGRITDSQQAWLDS